MGIYSDRSINLRAKATKKKGHFSNANSAATRTNRLLLNLLPTHSPNAFLNIGNRFFFPSFPAATTPFGAN